MRSTRRRLVAAALVTAWGAAACGKPAKHHKDKKKHRDHDAGEQPVHAHDEGKLGVDPWAKEPTKDCERLPFAASIPIAEASAAALLPGRSGPQLLVIGDSGTSGAYVEVGADDGHLIASGNLPLGDGAGDDLEGLAYDGVRVWGLTSGGWMRAWVRDGDQFRLDLGPYPAEPKGPCKHDGVNCGHDFEGLCLRPGNVVDSAGCVGYAAARAAGSLFCLHLEGGKLVLAVADGYQSAHPGPKVSKGRALADCAIGADGAVWTGDNLLGGAMVRRLAAPTWQGTLGDGFPEAMALAPGGVIYRFSDTGTAPSLAARYHCPAAEVAAGGGVIVDPPIAIDRDP